jgi:hypothetical protein
MAVRRLHYLTETNNRTNWQRNRVSHMHAIRHHSLDIFLHSRRIHRHSEPVWMDGRGDKRRTSERTTEHRYRCRHTSLNTSPRNRNRNSNKARDLHLKRKKDSRSYIFTTPIHATTTSPRPANRPAVKKHTRPPGVPTFPINDPSMVQSASRTRPNHGRTAQHPLVPPVRRSP